MPWVTTIAKQDYASGTLQHAGGGDPDITSKPGRQTRVELKTSNLRVDDQQMNILVDVYYAVTEVAKNNTFLTWNGSAQLPIPADAQRHAIVIQDTRNYNQSWIVLGKHHEWMELDSVDNTVVERGSFRIDGSGDDQNNAGVQLSSTLPISRRWEVRRGSRTPVPLR
jgi:hypothetical protein